MAFLDDNYLLGAETARGLYEEVRELPIVDPHNHADVAAIRANRNFSDIWAAEVATDHYVWELLRKRGVSEAAITGTELGNEEKWLTLGSVFDEFVGNPTFEWVHLDLRRCLGIEDLICSANAAKIWSRARDVLQQPEMRPQSLLKTMKVESMCSTDDPTDLLEDHQFLQKSAVAGMIRPTFRPDRAMNIFAPDWLDYIRRLEARTGSRLKSIRDLIAALQQTHDYFAENGCVSSDHGVQVPYGFRVETEDADPVFRKALDGTRPDAAETVCYMSYLLGELAEMDAAKDWVFQLHIGAVRDVRVTLFDEIGPDSGGDVSDHLTDILTPLRALLNRFDERLKIVLYAMEPGHQATLATVCRAFGANVNLGVAWWMNDSPIGMRRQLEYIGTVDLLTNLAGMVSDSRKLLSYGSRHEIFRRVLCDVVGRLVDAGQAPLLLGEKLVRHLCYRRPKALFGL